MTRYLRLAATHCAAAARQQSAPCWDSPRTTWTGSTDP